MVDGQPRGSRCRGRTPSPGRWWRFACRRLPGAHPRGLAPKKVARGGHGNAEVQRALNVQHDVEKVLLGLAAAFRRWCRQWASKVGRRKNGWRLGPAPGATSGSRAAASRWTAPASCCSPAGTGRLGGVMVVRRNGTGRCRTPGQSRCRVSLWHWREGPNLTECGMSRLPEKELELAMEAIQRRKSSLLKRTAMVARTVASADREQEQCAPDKEQERRMGWSGSWWPSPDGRRGRRAPRRAAPTWQRARRGN
jgi:hypothetical protein